MDHFEEELHRLRSQDQQDGFETRARRSLRAAQNSGEPHSQNEPTDVSENGSQAGELAESRSI